MNLVRDRDQEARRARGLASARGGSLLAWSPVRLRLFGAVGAGCRLSATAGPNRARISLGAQVRPSPRPRRAECGDRLRFRTALFDHERGDTQQVRDVGHPFPSQQQAKDVDGRICSDYMVLAQAAPSPSILVEDGSSARPLRKHVRSCLRARHRSDTVESRSSGSTADGDMGSTYRRATRHVHSRPTRRRTGKIS